MKKYWIFHICSFITGIIALIIFIIGVTTIPLTTNEYIYRTHINSFVISGIVLCIISIALSAYGQRYSQLVILE